MLLWSDLHHINLLKLYEHEDKTQTDFANDKATLLDVSAFRLLLFSPFSSKIQEH